MKKKKLLILGASGFIGKNLAIFFSKKKNFRVTGTYFHKKTFIKNVKMVQCDLTKKKEADKGVRGIDIIIQAAATTSGAKDILAKPYIHVNDNAIINSMITRSAYYYNVKHLIVFSCSVMYQSSKKPLKESDFNPSDDIYPNYFGAGWMKVFVEKMCEFYSRLGKNKYTLIRHSNIYGPNDKFDLEKSHVLAASVNKIISCKNNKVIIWGDGKEERDLLFISDLINFVDLAIKKQKNMQKHKTSMAFQVFDTGTKYQVTTSKRKIVATINRSKAMILRTRITGFAIEWVIVFLFGGVDGHPDRPGVCRKRVCYQKHRYEGRQTQSACESHSYSFFVLD